MHPLFGVAVFSVPMVMAATMLSPRSTGVSTRWAGAGCGVRPTPPPCTSRYPLLGMRLDPALWSWQSPKGWRFAWLRDPAYLAAWSQEMDHDLVSFMHTRPETDFAFGVVDRDGTPKASFVLEWRALSPERGTWAIQFAQGHGADPVDQPTFEAIAAFGAWLGLDCIPLAG